MQSQGLRSKYLQETAEPEPFDVLVDERVPQHAHVVRAQREPDDVVRCAVLQHRVDLARAIANQAVAARRAVGRHAAAAAAVGGLRLAVRDVVEQPTRDLGQRTSGRWGGVGTRVCLGGKLFKVSPPRKTGGVYRGSDASGIRAQPWHTARERISI